MSADLNMTSASVPDLDIPNVTLLNKAGEAGQVTYCETEAKASFLPAGGPAFTSECKPGGQGCRSGGR